MVVKKKQKKTNTLEIREKLDVIEKELHGKYSLFGPTLLNNPGYVTSSRNIMFTSHLRQFMNLLNPDFPKVCTGFENVVGKHSTGKYDSERNYTVVDKVYRFLEGDNTLYYIIVYDEENDYYDIIEKKPVENLTERYGYRYNTEVLDTKDVGCKIEKGERVYASTSYNEDKQYGYGKHAKVVFMLENYTIEDAIISSESFAKSLMSTEVDKIRISLNDNDILANLHGDNENYKVLPDIGETINGSILACSKRIHNNQLLYDLKPQNLRKVNFATDTPYYCDGVVEDIFIYANKPLEEIPENRFNRQILNYLKMQEKYFMHINEVCGTIVNSGSSYSDDIGYYYKKSLEYLNTKSKWVSDNNVAFNNIVIDILVSHDVELKEGQKIAG